jgi:phosphinothricin acetyltransferase
LVCVENDQVLGYAYASRHNDRAAYQWSVNMAVYVREDQHRNGIGRALYTSLIECLKLQGFYSAHAGITLPNAGSMALHRSMGFKEVGVYPSVGFKQGAWHDVVWLQLPLRDRIGTPRRPLTMEEGRGDPRWDSAIAAGSQHLL